MHYSKCELAGKHILERIQSAKSMGFVLSSMTGAIFLAILVVGGADSHAQEVNYDETAVPSYSLPDPLVMTNGTPVTDASTWREQRRPEVLGLFEQHVYGKMPDRTVAPRFEIKSLDTNALGGMATRKEIVVYLSEDSATSINILL